jgi:aspartyl-tRNA(Asn)/glutamyl-tRNA(Gln) amidotransferase subunit B
MKNLNSFRAITNAIENEAKRQIKLIENGEEVILETRRWDDIKMESYSMRSKEEAKDYRYFPEPDLVELALEDSLINNIKEAQPEFADEKKERYIKDYELPEYDARLLTESKIIAEYFEEVAGLCGNPKKASNWFIGEVFRLLKDEQKEPEDLRFTPKYLADIINVVSEGKINLGNAKVVFEEVFRTNVEPLEFMKEHGLMMVSDTGAIEAAVVEVLAECANVVEDYYSGKDRAFGYLVGQVMKKMRGKGDPGKVNEILREKLER